MQKRQVGKLKGINKNNMFWIWEILVFVLAIIICAIGLILLNFTTHKNIGKLFGLTGYYILLAIPLAFVVYILIRTLQLIKRGFFNMHYYAGYDEEHIFQLIDKYKLGDNRTIQYLICIKKINEIYASDVIACYLHKKRIKIFYERKQFLEKHSNLFYDTKEFMRAVLISFSSGFLSQLTASGGETTGFAVVVSYFALILIVLCALILPYAQKELFGDMLYEIDKYEIEKINECIKQIESAPLEETEYLIQQLAFETKCTLYEDAKINKKKEQKKISQWELVPTGELREEDYTSILATVDCGETPSPIYFVINNKSFWESYTSCGFINRQQLKDFLISSDYKSCFEYVEKYFGTSILFPNNEVIWSEDN